MQEHRYRMNVTRSFDMSVDSHEQHETSISLHAGLHLIGTYTERTDMAGVLHVGSYRFLVYPQEITGLGATNDTMHDLIEQTILEATTADANGDYSLAAMRYGDALSQMRIMRIHPTDEQYTQAEKAMKIAHNRMHQRPEEYKQPSLTDHEYAALGLSVVDMVQRLGGSDYRVPTIEEADAIWCMLCEMIEHIRPIATPDDIDSVPFPYSTEEMVEFLLPERFGHPSDWSLARREGTARVALAIDPTDVNAYHRIADWYHQRGDYRSAKTWLERAIAAGRVGLAEYFEEAMHDFEDVYSKPLGEVLGRCAFVCSLLDEYEEAVALGQEYISLFSDRFGMREMLLSWYQILENNQAFWDGIRYEWKTLADYEWKTLADYSEGRIESDNTGMWHSIIEALDAFKQRGKLPPDDDLSLYFAFPGCNDYLTETLYALLLHRYIQHGARDRITQSLRERALASNPHIPALLKQSSFPPEPASVFGEKEGWVATGSARAAWDYLRYGGWNAWKRHPKAVRWLSQNHRVTSVTN